MNKLELGKFWLVRLAQALPESSIRMRTRLAWHLAALSVGSDAEFAGLTEAQLARFAGGSTKFLELRGLYLRQAPGLAAPLAPPAPKRPQRITLPRSAGKPLVRS
jgi:hypothetical protein